jgi:mono/diheme cytochrome c family protein
VSTLRTALLCIIISVDCASGQSLIQSAPAAAASKTNPLSGQEEARRAGSKLYARECASCHGDRREGRSKAPPLDRGDVRQAAAGSLFWVLRNGELRRGMPSFAHLPEVQRWQIITFLKNRTQSEQ